MWLFCVFMHYVSMFISRIYSSLRYPSIYHIYNLKNECSPQNWICRLSGIILNHCNFYDKVLEMFKMKVKVELDT